MVTTAARVDWTVVGTEVEALQLEYAWIKEFDPRFNVNYRDDKSYPFLAVTLDEEFPRLQVMRGAKRKGVRYFGPYSHAWAIRETLDLLLRVFPARTCSRRGVQARRPDRPAVPARLHRQVLGAVRRPGRRRRAPRRSSRTSATSWRARPTRSCSALEQRDDGRVRASWSSSRRPGCATTSGALRRAMEKQAVVFGDGTDADVVAFAEDPLEAAVQVFHVRGGRVRGQRGWVVEKVEDRRHRRPGRSTSAARSTASEAGRARCPREVLVPELPSRRRRARGAGSAEHAGRAGRAAGAAARRQASADGDGRRATPAQALTLHKTKRGRRPDHPQPGARGDRRGARPGRRRRCGSSASTSRNSRAPTWSPSWSSSRTGWPARASTAGSSIRGVERPGRRRGDARGDHAAGSPATRRARPSARLDRATARTRHRCGPVLIDPDTGRPRKFAYPPQLVVVDGGAPQVARGAARARRAGHRRRRGVRAGQAARGGLAARRRRPGDPAAHLRGALPAAAGPRRGAPVRDHLPPERAVQADDGERCWTTFPGWARSGARRCCGTSAR